MTSLTNFRSNVGFGNNLVPTNPDSVSTRSACVQCGDRKGDCRTIADKPDLILCRKVMSPSDILNDAWTFKGMTKCGTWGMVSLTKRKELTAEEKREYAIAKAQREEAAAKRNMAIIAAMPAIEKRHNDLAKKIEQGYLSRPHEIKIKGRGLNDEDIKRMGLHSSSTGIIIPIPNIDGLWSGIQIKTNNGDYRWATGSTNWLRETGQLPLAFWGNTKNPDKIIFVEGVGFKAYIASLMFPQSLVIGAAGGNFVASSKQLAQAIERFPKASIVLMADAGSTSNKSVINQYKSVYNFLFNADREMKIGWWGQVDKSKGDIDEIALDTQIELISWAKFASMIDTMRFYEKALFYVERIYTKFRPEVKTVEPKKISVIEYQSTSDMEKLLVAKITAAGGTVVWDKSGAGSGKSTIAGAMRELPGYKGVMYVSEKYRNPTVLTVENSFVPIPSCNSGTYYDIFNLTPGGQPQRFSKQPSGQNLPKDGGNCSRAEMKNQWREKGYPDDESNPVCAACPFSEKCRYESGDGYGYKHQLKIALQNNRLRCSRLSMPNPATFDYTGWLIIFDDEKIINVQEMAVDRAGVEKTIAKLFGADPDLATQLAPILNSIQSKFTEAAHFGHDHSDMFDGIETEITNELINKVANITIPDKSSIKFSDIKSGFREKMDTLGVIFNDNRVEIVDLVPNWLVSLLEILAGNIEGKARMSSNILIVKTESNYHRTIIKKAMTTLVLDATEYLEDLAADLKMGEDEITVISQSTTNHFNVTVYHVTGIVNTSKDQSTESTRQIAALTTAIAQKHGDVSPISKVHGAANRWWSSTRGSNAFERDSTLLPIGAPIPNLGQLADEFSIVRSISVSATSQLPEFLAFVRRRTMAEINQMVGRLRSQRRPDEQLHIYFVYDRHDLPFADIEAAYPGIQIKETPVEDICLEAASAPVQRRVLVRKLMNANPRIKQAEIALEMGVAVSTISDDFKQLGGFKKTSATLVRGLYSRAEVLNSELADWSNWLESSVVEYMRAVLVLTTHEGYESADAAILARSADVATIVESLTDAQLKGLFGQLSKQEGQEVIECLRLNMMASIPTQSQIDATTREFVVAS